jgi:predicted aldo/keto reductase-like oxidoreductase
MEYRKVPHGKEELSVIGLGLGNIEADKTGETISYAVEHGINFFDLCCSTTDVFKEFGRSVNGKRDRVFTQMHFGAVYPDGKYAFSRVLDEIKRSFDTVMDVSRLGYTDFGFVHCVDEESDLQTVMDGGLFGYMQSLKSQGVIRHIGFSSHTPSVARKLVETGEVDTFMFSINPAYEYTKGEFANGLPDVRSALYSEAQKRGIGITVMKPFAGGQLLDEKRSPIGIALTPVQCLAFALGRPAVLACVPGASNVENVKTLLEYADAPPEQKDYAILGTVTPETAAGRCVYCNHCAPCPAGIDIGLVNKYYDLAKNGDELAADHYRRLSVNAGACTECGHCDQRCPFKVRQKARMKEIKIFFNGGRE